MRVRGDEGGSQVVGDLGVSPGGFITSVWVSVRTGEWVVPAGELPIRKREREVKIVFIRTSFSTIFIK